MLFRSNNDTWPYLRIRRLNRVNNIVEFLRRLGHSDFNEKSFKDETLFRVVAMLIALSFFDFDF